MRREEDKIPGYKLNYILPIVFGLIGAIFVWATHRDNEEIEIKIMVRNCWIIVALRFVVVMLAVFVFWGVSLFLT